MRLTSRKSLIVCVLYLAATMFSFSALAKKEPPYTDHLPGDSLYAGKTLIVQDPVFFNPTLNATVLRTNSVDNIISFRINENDPKMLPDSFKAELKVRLIYTNVNNVVDSVTEKTFNIDYYKNRTYKSKDIYFLSGAYKMIIKVISLTPTYATSNNIAHALELENKIQIDRDYIMNPVSGSSMDCSANAIQEVYKDTSTIAQYGELKVSWAVNSTVAEYELEWTYIDKSAIDNGRYNTSGQLDPNLIFKNNASRITTSATEYMIPLLYDGQGSLFYRVRGVQTDPNGERIATLWSSEFVSAGGLGRYDFNGHERMLNWQASTSFAEEAKRKTVVQYFDGSLRNRQTVTRDNTTQTTVVAETLYDKQGRPMIQVMPAPTLNTLIGYTPLFNRSVNNSEYDKGVYDTVVNASDYCATSAPKMSDSSGASRYYSPYNPEKNSGFNKYIPNGRGYAFTETQYEQDNTGRIKKQSGVDSVFMLGKGHETKYFYEGADQGMLDALFGTEAGDFSHYQRNIVRDANGQYSVSYVDMHGRTIATALMGNNPTSLQRLGSYWDSVQTEKLLNPINNIINGNKIQWSRSFVVAKADTFRFNYGLAADSLTIKDCNNLNICYDCLYDLDITISDDCNNQQFGGNPLVIKKSNFKLFQIDTVCNTVQSLDTAFNVFLPEGSYHFSKVLAISEKGMQYYRDSLFAAHNNCKSYEDFLNEEKARIRSTFDCQIDPVTTYEYQTIRMNMMADMIPLVGQYADTGTMANARCFSIFDRLSDGTYKYQARDFHYPDEEGNPALVMNSLGQMVKPNDLTVEEFIASFSRSWADALIIKHPEYTLLQKYETFATSFQWEENFKNTDTYAQAKASHYLNPTGNNVDAPASGFDASNPDPLFNGLPESIAAKSALHDSLFHFQNIKDASGNDVNTTLWGMATAMAKCNTQGAGDPSCFTTWIQNNKAFSESELCTGELDMAWRFFRDMYVMRKNNWILNYIKSTVGNVQVLPPCYAHFADVRTILQQEGLGISVGDSTVMKIKANDLFADNCKAYASRWWEQLNSSCTSYSTADSTIIIPYLIQVCREGSDVTHPFGSSSVKPGSAYRFTSFEQVIKFYNDSTGRTTDANCNAYLIDKPLPYGGSQPLVNMPYYSKPDSCSCAKIDTLYAQFNAQSGLYGTFSNFLSVKYKTTISQASLDSLRGLCSGSITCKFLAEPISIPPALQCGVQNTCVGCTQVVALYDTFLMKFPGVVPSYQEIDQTQAKYNSLFANYMNSNLGFNLYTKDYLTFIDSCKGKRTVTGTSFCDTLILMRNDFINNYYNYGIQYDEDGNDISTWIADYAGSTNNTGIPHRELFANGIAHNPYNTPSSLCCGNDHMDYDYMFPGRRDSACLGNNLTVEVKVKYPIADAIKDYGYFQTLYYFDNGNITCVFPQAPTFWSYYSLGNTVNPHRDTTILDISEFVHDLSDWHIYKQKIANGECKVYFDDTLIKTLPYFGPVSKLYGFSFSFGTHANITGSIDWIKLRDSTGKIVYFEDFLTPHKFSHISDSSGACPKQPCDQAFAKYYNTKRQTNYTFSQIDSIYQSTCGESVGICGAMPSYTLCRKSQALNEPFRYIADDPCSDSTEFAIIAATEKYRIYKDSLRGAFEEAYQQKCLNAVNLENFTVRHSVSEYHYTLYYYDLAGNLVKTVPPEGVNPIRRQSWLDSVSLKRNLGQSLVPAHNLATVYRYNSLNQVATQQSPDGGYSEFWYDRLGRLSVSRNEKQKDEGNYSYTQYDGIGRISEVGQKRQPTAMTGTISRDTAQLRSWLNYTYTNASGQTVIAEQVTFTAYDTLDNFLYSQVGARMRQRSHTLRNRVSFTRFYDNLLFASGKPTYGDFNSSTTFSYDIHGNVDSLMQLYRKGLMGEHGENRFKLLAYQYDLISGKVNQVHYQSGQADQFYHRYVYDAENRITDVYTTDRKVLIGDETLEEHDAKYAYYKHGPLARTELGQQKVQGIDYAYTLQGWLKGVNCMALGSARDMGGDGTGVFAKDEYGFYLNYYTGDYKSINESKTLFPGHSAYMGGDHRDLFNGNITSMAVNIGKFNQSQMYNYKYDQLNRLVEMDTWRGFDTANNNWTNITKVEDYKERISYDGNGNILTYLRNGSTGAGKPLSMDNLTYNYFRNGSGSLRNNRLRMVRDNSAYTGHYEEDINDQLPSVLNASDSNYVYDKIGNLIRDKAEGIDSIYWSVYGKILKIKKLGSADGQVKEIYYTYDAAGNRISKRVVSQNKPDKYTWYARDASGNVMSTYEFTGNDITASGLALKEIHLYGSSRLGIYERNINMDAATDNGTTVPLLGNTYSNIFERGNKFFELSNHLGNVLAVVSDKKFGVDANTDGTIDYYTAEVRSAQDYYPFGMLMPGRRGYLQTGGSTTGGAGGGSGSGLPADLGLSERNNNQPTEYKATNSIEFVDGFVSGTSDEFVAYITTDQTVGGGSGSYNWVMDGNAGYRYGFNGKENDNDVKGQGEQQDYGMRIYDPRLGKFLSVDPLTKSYPWYTPYQFAGNMPIVAVDLDGLEQYVVTYYKDQNNATTKIAVRSIFDNNGAVLNQHVHKNGPTGDVTTSNVLVFVSKNLKNGKESLSIIDQRKFLTPEEEHIFNSYKKPEEEGGAEQSLVYPDEKNSQFESRSFSNAKTKTYIAFFGLAPPPNIDKTSSAPPVSKTNGKTSVAKISSKIEFEGNDNTPLGNFDRELNTIVNKVKASNIVDYQITIYGNADGFFWEDFDAGSRDTYKKGFDTIGKLAIGRANKIREMLIGKGLDASKIKTVLGSPTKSMSADYQVTTTSTP